MHRAQRCPVSSPSQDGCTPLEDAAPQGEHRMAGRTTLSPLCTPGQATGQGQAVVWGGWPHGWLSLFALDATTGAIKHRVTLGDSCALPSPRWDALLSWSFFPSCSPSHFLPEREISLQPHPPGLAQ